MKKINAIKEYALKNGQTRYRFTIRVDKDHVTSRNGFYDYSSAELAYHNLKQDVLQQKYKIDQDKYAFQDLYDSWIKEYEQTVRDTTFFKTKRCFHNHILPFFGKKYVTKITIKDCQDAVNSWIETVAVYKPIVRDTIRILDIAVKYDYIASNPMRKIDLPNKTKKMQEVITNRKPKNYYSLDELHEFLKAAKTISLQKFTIFRTFAYTGTRIGECIGLKWSDIDFDNNYISINKTLVYSNKNKQYELHPTKNGRTRNLIMDQQTMDILAAWKEIQSNKDNIDNFVFTNSSGHHWTHKPIEEWQMKINKQIKLDRHITIHGFRHTHATLLYDMNPTITPKDVQKRLGHSNVDITMNIYEHVTDNSDGKVLDALNDLDKDKK